MEVLEKDWFCSKKCLDIGCNSGHLTLEIARTFAPSSILGVDIDAKLIEKAKQGLEGYNSKARKTAEYPKSFEITLGPLPKKMTYLRNLAFSSGNFLEHSTTEKYDVILW
jgi:7SK snRNA methylphosphate capping enzyme